MTDWLEAKQYEDITYHKAEGMARIAFNRPEVRNAFRPKTVDELIDAFNEAWQDHEVGVILFTGNGPAKDGKYAFCSGVVNGSMPYAGGTSRAIASSRLRPLMTSSSSAMSRLALSLSH